MQKKSNSRHSLERKRVKCKESFDYGFSCIVIWMIFMAAIVIMTCMVFKPPLSSYEQCSNSLNGSTQLNLDFTLDEKNNDAKIIVKQKALSNEQGLYSLGIVLLELAAMILFAILIIKLTSYSLRESKISNMRMEYDSLKEILQERKYSDKLIASLKSYGNIISEI